MIWQISFCWIFPHKDVAQASAGFGFQILNLEPIRFKKKNFLLDFDRFIPKMTTYSIELLSKFVKVTQSQVFYKLLDNDLAEQAVGF